MSELSQKFYIFDMDGTLIDSEPIGPQTFIDVFKASGYAVSESDKLLFVQSWRRVGEYTHQDELLRSLAHEHLGGLDVSVEFYEKYKSNLLHATPLPHVEAFLRQAKSHGKQLVVVSASRREQIRTVLNNNDWLELFDFIVGAEDVTAHKPDPEGYLYAIKKLSTTPDEVVIFEDSKNGVLAAKSSGSYAVAITRGSAPGQDVSDADLIVDTFKDILDKV